MHGQQCEGVQEESRPGSDRDPRNDDPGGTVPAVPPPAGDEPPDEARDDAREEEGGFVLRMGRKLMSQGAGLIRLIHLSAAQSLCRHACTGAFHG